MGTRTLTSDFVMVIPRHERSIVVVVVVVFTMEHRIATG